MNTIAKRIPKLMKMALLTSFGLLGCQTANEEPQASSSEAIESNSAPPFEDWAECWSHVKETSANCRAYDACDAEVYAGFAATLDPLREAVTTAERARRDAEEGFYNRVYGSASACWNHADIVLGRRSTESIRWCKQQAADDPTVATAQAALDAARAAHNEALAPYDQALSATCSHAFDACSADVTTTCGEP